MNLLQDIEHSERPEVRDLFRMLREELSEALAVFWSAASHILADSGIRLLPPPPGHDSLERNFFSGLFLYSFHRAGIPRPRRITYAAVNQCLRGMVTGCDNLLDDEYKATLTTDLPATGVRFRSVLDIMVADRVLFEILLQEHRQNGVDLERVRAASSATLRALTRSGVQEAAEEGGAGPVIEPSELLRTVHHFKTGLLFQCPWAVPALLEEHAAKDAQPLMDALYKIGMGCQILDDMVDFAADIARRHHNYLASVIYHGGEESERRALGALMAGTVEEMEREDGILRFPAARRHGARIAIDYLEEGLAALFTHELHALIPKVIETLAGLIGAHRFIFRRGDEGR